MTLRDRTPLPKPEDEHDKKGLQIIHYFWSETYGRWSSGYGTTHWEDGELTTEHLCGDPSEPCVVYERKITVGRWKARENGEAT